MTIQAVYWNTVADILPAEGEHVMTMSPHGQQQLLQRKGRLWFFTDGSMYVYYVPLFWRPLTEEERNHDSEVQT